MSIQFLLMSVWFQLISTRFQLISIRFPFLSIRFQLSSKPIVLISIGYRLMPLIFHCLSLWLKNFNKMSIAILYKINWFLYFRLIRYSWQWTYNINFADDWFRTADLWSQKRLLYQLCHNLCPIESGRIRAKISIPPFQNHFANGTLEYLCL